MADEIKRGRGRPKGTGGNKRPDSGANVSSSENRKYIMHDLAMWDWVRPDMTNPKAVDDRIKEYLKLCVEDDMKPSVAGLALAFGISRKTLWKWINGIESNFVASECRDALKKIYLLLNSQMENYMQNGNINPVAGIFLMKNNMGYEDKQEMVVSPTQPLGDQVSPEQLQQKYLDDVSSNSVIEVSDFQTVKEKQPE